MPLVVAVWPNNTISVIKMPNGFSMVDLFNEIDAEANPVDAKCYLVAPSWDGLYVTFDWDRLEKNENAVAPKSRGLRVECLYGRKKRLHWPPGIARMWLRSLASQNTRAKEVAPIGTMSSADIASLPAEPQETFTVDEVRAMDDFPGVYFAYNQDGSCHYVGESEAVPRRVSKSRPEIGSRRIGVIKVEKHARKRVEAYFVAMLDPPGNKISTHAMRSKES